MKSVKEWRGEILEMAQVEGYDQYCLDYEQWAPLIARIQSETIESLAETLEAEAHLIAHGGVGPVGELGRDYMLHAAKIVRARKPEAT